MAVTVVVTLMWGEGVVSYLLCLLQQLHALMQDLAIKLAALPQDLPPHLLHRSSQILPLHFIQ